MACFKLCRPGLWQATEDLGRTVYAPERRRSRTERRGGGRVPSRGTNPRGELVSILVRALSRRTFLKASVAGGGLLVSFSRPARIGTALAGGAPPAGDFMPNGFIRIDRDGRVTLIMHKVEMGQGTYTSMPMLLAEELEVDLSQVHLEHA